MTSRSSGSAREVAASLMGEPSPRTLALLKKLERTIAARPDDPRLQVRKGKALERMLKFGAALSFAQGRILRELHRLKAAIPYYQRCLSLTGLLVDEAREPHESL